ncbi:MAG: sigma 54-interacting transcriptional regulator [Ignavibacteriae bacterium]|nr:PAS domain-containing protein [Ignavibacteriota bacterium]NOG97969.1 sigma 54-interacting transcriptional regulator [Ignavibacteriota bacterium]
MPISEEKIVALKHANEILNSIVEGVFTVDKNLKITYLNTAAERITGVKQGDAIGHYCFETLRSNLCEIACPIKHSIKTGENVVNNQVKILRPDGKEIPVSINASVLKDEQGNIIGGVETFRDFSAIESLKKEIEQKYTYEDIISKNHKILEIFSILPNIAESESTVLVQGQSGSGKELFARAIHNLSYRSKGPFVAVNCGALPDNLLESELFGYKKGAFTDAKKDKPGRFELARGGTIFLDEVESLSPSTQVKLLRVLQEKEFEPLGSTAPVKSDVRIISATKTCLNQLVKKDKFRDDLFFRLNIVRIELPPLIHRRDDIPLLINHFIEKFGHKMHKYITGVSGDVLELLMNYDYSGNVRELENIIEHAFVMCQEEIIQLKHLPPEISLPQESKNEVKEITNPLETTERKTIKATLEKHNWNKVEAAKALNLHRSTLWRKMKKLGLT